MPVGSDHTHDVDPGLFALVLMLRCLGIGAEAEEVRERCGTAAIGIPEMLRCANKLGLKARTCRTRWKRLARTPLPGIAVLRDGGFLIIVKVAENKAVVLHPRLPHPETITQAVL